MADALEKLDWSLVQVFLAVAEHGSLTGAARHLRTSQPTVGRQVREIEDQLGVKLFTRHERGLALTELGRSLVSLATMMKQAARELELLAVGYGETLSGTVRISASEAVSLEHLPRIVEHIRRKEPTITIELVPSDVTSRLHFREADIAIRMYRPQQLDLVTQHIGDLTLVACASRSYLKRRGKPKSPEELTCHDIIGMDRSTQIIEGFRKGGIVVDRDFFKVRTDHTGTYLALLRAGCGIGFTQRAIVRGDSRLFELPLDLGLPALPVWLTALEVIR
jgi:DNA-binding transcriptional LysR family regulator